MRKLTLLIAFMAFATFNYAVTTVENVKRPINAKQVLIPVGKSGQVISLYDLARIKPKELQELTGKKMNLADKLGLKIAQRDLKKSINPDGTLNGKKFDKLAKKMAAGDTGFHAGGFFLGFLLGLIGVLIAYLINDDKKRNRVKWAWIGWIAWVIILIALIV